MKRTLDELLAAVNTIVGEDNTSDAVLALIEDLTDTLNAETPDTTSDEMRAEIENLKTELEAQKKRYKDRFFGKVEEAEAEEETEEDDKPNGLTITTKDIFKNKED